MGKIAAQSFADYFSSVFPAVPTISSHSTTPKPTASSSSININLSSKSVPGTSNVTTPNPIHIPTITTSSVISAIATLKSNNSSGIDKIPNFLIKKFAAFFAPVLASIFNRCLVSSIFPSLWNTALIVPILKSGDPKLVTNYRPISICNVFSKIFERTIHTTVAPLIYNLLNPNQHGFVPCKSTSTNLVSLMSYLAPRISKGLQVDCVYFDLKKAFDLVDHSILLTKLKSFGFSSQFLSFFQSYLSTRICKVKINSCLSSSYKANSGVHQGSILGPLLFLIFINDLCSFINCSFLLFADDLKIFLEILNSSSCLHLQSIIDNILLWCSINNMSINADKTSIISFTRRRCFISFDYNLAGLPLKRVFKTTDLGVIIDSRLKFDDYIDSIVAKASRRLGLIRRVCHGLSLACFLRLYISLVRPLLEYAVPVWNNLFRIRSDQVERIQRLFIRICYLRFFHNRIYYSYETLSKRLGLHSLRVRRKAFEVLYLAKALCGDYTCEEVKSQVIVLPVGRRASRFAYIKELSDISPLVRGVSQINRLFLTDNTVSI